MLNRPIFLHRFQISIEMKWAHCNKLPLFVKLFLLTGTFWQSGTIEDYKVLLDFKYENTHKQTSLK